MRAGIGLVVFGLASAGLGMQFPGGAPSGFAGDVQRSDGSPQTCTACHSGNALNDANGGGSVTIDAPDGATPGETVSITVTVVNDTPEVAGGRRQGFSATVRDPATGAFVGSFSLPDPTLVQVTTGNDVSYTTHTSASNRQLSWTFDWVAPSSGVPSEVVVYTAGNAANGAGTGGDFIYTDTHTISLASVAAEVGPVADVGLAWAPVAPNPVRGLARAELVLDAPAHVVVRLVDGQGRLVRQLGAETRPAGASRVNLDVRGVAPGVYFLVAETEMGRRTQAVSVVR